MDLDASQSARLGGGVTGLLLAGGESRRMGCDKAELPVCGELLWKRQVRTLLAGGAGEIVISRGDQPPLPELDRGILTVADAARGCGPLGGVVGALRQMRGE